MATETVCILFRLDRVLNHWSSGVLYFGPFSFRHFAPSYLRPLGERGNYVAGTYENFYVSLTVSPFAHPCKQSPEKHSSAQPTPRDVVAQLSRTLLHVLPCIYSFTPLTNVLSLFSHVQVRLQGKIFAQCFLFWPGL